MSSGKGLTGTSMHGSYGRISRARVMLRSPPLPPALASLRTYT